MITTSCAPCRSVRVDPPHTTAAEVYGVLGPFVLVTPDYLPASDNAAVLVLDTRTGAFAALDEAVANATAGHDTLILSGPDGSVRVATSRLPGLTC